MSSNYSSRKSNWIWWVLGAIVAYFLFRRNSSGLGVSATATVSKTNPLNYNSSSMSSYRTIGYNDPTAQQISAGATAIDAIGNLIQNISSSSGSDDDGSDYDL